MGGVVGNKLWPGSALVFACSQEPLLSWKEIEYCTNSEKKLRQILFGALSVMK